MIFAKHLRKEGDKFRKEFLNSEDENDSTVMKKDWRKNKKKEGSAKGGPYLAVHLRRADFLYARPDHVPTLDGAVKQVKKIMKEQNVTVVFLATDASQDGKTRNCKVEGVLGNLFSFFCIIGMNTCVKQ